MKFIGWITTTLLVTVACGIINALVYAQLYRWFMLPVGAPALTTPQLYGVLFFVGAILTRSTSKDEDTELKDVKWGKVLGKGIARCIARAIVLLAGGWALHHILYQYAY
jgi:DMSO reductase anchor subunit